jgi:hypothetical protein
MSEYDGDPWAEETERMQNLDGYESEDDLSRVIADDPDFEAYQESMEYDECDMAGHDWIIDYAGEAVCQRCGATYYEEEGL